MATVSDTADVRRVTVALGTVAAAYFSALAKGAFGVASGLLAAFQEAYNVYRPFLVASYGAELRMQVEQALPARLEANGVYTRATRVVLASILTRAFYAVPGGPSRGVSVGDLPSSAAQAGAWFKANVASRLDDANDPEVVRGVQVLTAQSPASAAGEAGAWLVEAIEGISQPSSSPAPTPDEGPTTLPATTILGERTAQGADWPTVLFWGALGLALAGGGYAAWRTYRGRR
jgi:hypothetical protein